MKRLYTLLLLHLAFCLGGCEDIEDTYGRFSKEGMIRYVGKCSEVTLTPGWKRMELSWKNSLDPTVVKIKVTWIGTAFTRDTLLDAKAESCNITGLNDEVYTFRVCAIDKDGNISLAEENYGKPYTFTHEAVNGISKVIIKYFRIKDNVILFFDDWQETIDEACLTYYRGKEKQELEVTPEIAEAKYYVLKGIDAEQPLTVSRVGRVEGCPDRIAFQPDTLDFHNRAFLADAAKQLRNRYQQENIDNDAFTSSLTEVELDYDLKSLEDILYFPNLKKVSLGKNRYQDVNYLDYLNVEEMWGGALLEEIDKSLQVLDMANELMGVEVDLYNYHYLTDEDIEGRAYIHRKGNPSLPALNYLNTEGWTISAKEKDESGYDPYFENLLDNDPTTIWKPRMSSTMSRVHELIIDMKSEQTLSGLKIVQKAYQALDDDNSYLPGLVRIQLSSNNISWQFPLIADENVIGNTPGEATVLRFKEPQKARYIRIQVNDVAFFWQYYTLLADVAAFR